MFLTRENMLGAVKAKGRRSGGRIVLEYGSFFKSLTYITIFGSCFLIYLCSNEELVFSGVYNVIAWIIMALTLAFLVFEIFLSKITIDFDGIYSVSVWKGKRMMCWKHIDFLKWNEGMKCWILKEKFGKTVWISEMMDGIDDLMDELKKRKIRVIFSSAKK